MSSKSGIEWTDATWNPVVGCSAVSPGCDNCYAARDTSGRLKNVPVYAGLAVDGAFTGEIRELPDRLRKPLLWKKPRRIFVNSMSDLFHVSVSDEFAASVFDVMHDAHWHQFQVLTKRPQIMRIWVREYYEKRLGVEHVIPNLWLGTSIESNRYCFRARHLAQTLAAVRFLSCEPLLGPLPDLDLTGIHWVIVGGESGPNARPMHPDWVRDIRRRCRKARVPFLFKQWGEWAPERGTAPRAHTRVAQVPRQDPVKADPSSLTKTDAMMYRIGRTAAGRVLDGRTWDEYPRG